MSKISILGAGGWGLALALAAHRADNDVTVWSRSYEEVALLRSNRENSRLLPGVMIPADIRITNDISDVCGCDITVIATPSSAVRETAKRLKGLECGIIVNVAKGIEYDTLMRLSQVITDELKDSRVAILSGPSHAEEVAREYETSLVASADDRSVAEYVQSAFMSDKLRVYTNNDLIGVELGGALKNVIAIAAGFCEGVGLGDNSKAALITRGLAEMTRLGVKMGADERTFSGLTGLGDLIVTCTSKHSRNNRFGKLVGGGTSVESALLQVGTVEGYHAVRSAYKIGRLYGIEMPITEQCFSVMYEGADVRCAIKKLMSRPPRSEAEIVWL